jgi:hypothetical protein
VVLHEREIRKQIAPFEFLRVPMRRAAFLADLNELIEAAPLDLIAVVIDKRRRAMEDNPYRAALGVGLVQITRYLRARHEPRLTHVVVESRGKNETEISQSRSRSSADPAEPSTDAISI